MSVFENVSQASIHLAGKMTENGIDVPGLVVGAERVMNSITHKQQLDFDPDLIRSIVGILEGVEDVIWPILIFGGIGHLVDLNIPEDRRKRSDGTVTHYGTLGGGVGGFLVGALFGGYESNFLGGFTIKDGFMTAEDVSSFLITLLKD